MKARTSTDNEDTTTTTDRDTPGATAKSVKRRDVMWDKVHAVERDLKFLLGTEELRED